MNRPYLEDVPDSRKWTEKNGEVGSMAYFTDPYKFPKNPNPSLEWY